MTAILNKNEFIHVSLGTIGWKVIKKGMVTPTLKHPVTVAKSKYSIKTDRIAVDMNVVPKVSQAFKLWLKKVYNGNPSYSIAIKIKLYFKIK